MTANYASTLQNIFQAIAPHSSESDVEKEDYSPTAANSRLQSYRLGTSSHSRQI